MSVELRDFPPLLDRQDGVCHWNVPFLFVGAWAPCLKKRPCPVHDQPRDLPPNSDSKGEG